MSSRRLLHVFFMRSRRPPRTRVFAAHVKRATLRTDSARRPLARTPVTKRAPVGCVGDLGVLSMRCGCCPTQRAVVPSASRKYAGPQHFCLFRGMCSAWVPGSVLGSLNREIRAFSSGSALASPSCRGSFVLRDRGHIKGQKQRSPDRYGDGGAVVFNGRIAGSESESAEQ
jgi:hypothetical protein